MIKRNPSIRNQRSKGFKVKHVLQVILLLGVCFWLIYQVKHNHDKKKEFDKNDLKLPSRTEPDQIVKLGRKDLLPGKVEVVDQNEKHEEEEEDEHVVDDVENKREHDEHQQEGEDGHKHETEESEENVDEVREEHGEEENKHGVLEEQEEDESKSEEIEDEGVDVETDENDHDKSDADNNDHDDDVVDDEKEKEEEGDEAENEEKEDEEKGGLVENHENHEAREEHYKGDDASSAVTHDTHSTSTETETSNLENADLTVQLNIGKPENETTYHSDESNRNQNDSDLKVTEDEVTDAISSNSTAGKEAGNDSSLVSDETVKTNTDSHLNVSSNQTAVITEASINSTDTGKDESSSSEQIKTVILSESDHAQNVTVNTPITGDIKQAEGLEQSGNKTSEANLPNNDATVSAKPEIRDAAPQESSTLGDNALEKTEGYVASNGTENISSSLDRNVSSNTTESDKSEVSTETSETNETQNSDVTEDEMFKGDTQTSDEKSDSSSVNDVLDSVVHDAIESADTHSIHEDMAKARTDLDTLPDIINEGNESDENAAE
ncbi:myb protein X [Trifolium repens]|nr:myb protein X [Trifolium repens]